jgi:hypothetical protein
MAFGCGKKSAAAVKHYTAAAAKNYPAAVAKNVRR